MTRTPSNLDKWMVPLNNILFTLIVCSALIAVGLIVSSCEHDNTDGISRRTALNIVQLDKELRK